jgi:hypothetical protein
LPLTRLLVVCALVLPACGAAPAAPDTADDVVPATPRGLEALRAWARATTVGLARGIDSWFGERPFEDGGKVEQGRLELRTSWRRDEGFDASVRLDARFELPNLRERAYAFLGRDVERDVVTDKPSAFARQGRTLADTERSSYFAGLAVPLSDRIELRAGLRSAFEVYAQARYANAWVLGESLRLDFRETVFWTDVDGFGSTTALAFTRALSPRLEVRWLNAGTVTQKSEGFEWSSLVGTYRSFGTDREMAAEALVSGKTASNVAVDDYGLRLRWTQPLHSDWLIGEFTVGHFWPRADAASPRESVWALGAAALMRF